ELPPDAPPRPNTSHRAANVGRSVGDGPGQVPRQNVKIESAHRRLPPATGRQLARHVRFGFAEKFGIR
ncbi:MAG: hypothetical protein DIZ77_18460, partial [endosymbiont of Seepiophila jonesi]